MSSEIDEARETLAFMRSLADGPEQPNRAMGQAFFAAGIVYGFQGLCQWGLAAGFLSLSDTAYLIFVVACSAVYMAILGAIIWKNRKKQTRTAVGRAYEAAFQGAGIANLCMVLVFTAASIRLDNAGIWYFYAPMIYAMQGAAWYLAFRMRKRGWLGLVSLGWFVGSVALGMTAHSATYVLVIALSLILLLGGPGWVMMRLADARSEQAG